MRSRLALILLAVVMSAGLIQILRLRVQSNDLLPDYSPLRTDPKGLAVLFNSLEATAAVRVSRFNRPPSLMKDSDATLVFAGVDLFNTLDEDTATEFEALARKGNRVLVTIAHAPPRGEKLRAVWDVRLKTVPKSEEDEPARWPTYFEASSKWKVLYSDKGHPLVIERPFDSGSILLLSSTWPLTNEAMVQDRRSEMLSALFSARPRVIFDESHLGMQENGTVMALSRRFHLQGFLMGLLLLACLFVWRNLAGFPPDRSSPEQRTGRDSLTGLSILLARNVPEKDLIETCLTQRKLPPDMAAGAKNTSERFEAIRQRLHVKKR